jgi:hypothetical protein
MPVEYIRQQTVYNGDNADPGKTYFDPLRVNPGLKYSFDGFMKALNAELLYLYTKRNGNIYNDRKYVINKVEMHQLNLVFNYIF